MKRNISILLVCVIAFLGLGFGIAVGGRLYQPFSVKAAPAPAVPRIQESVAASVPVQNKQEQVRRSVASAPSTEANVKEAEVRLEEPVSNADPITLESVKEPALPPPALTAEEESAATKPKLSGDAPVVCIDPGHPSETSDGAHANGLSENTLNWQVALKLRSRLEAMDIRCVMTKDSMNQRRTNRERAEIANRAGAAVFVRLHCDTGAGRGFTWYYPDRAGHKYGVTGPPKAVQQESRHAAFVINEAMKPVLRGYLQSNPIKTDASTFVGGKQGGVLTGSIFARVPTALIEMCFINKKNDAVFIASAAGQEKMAEALAQGIRAYVGAQG
jgi:N-acetylmuramoyl-L-alanine amidase